MAVGGDIIEVTFNHPTLGSGTLFPKAAEDSTFDLGGIRGNDDANALEASGNTIRQLSMTRWSFESTYGWDMNNREDLEKLADLAGNPEEADWTFTSINGSVYGGKGAPVGDLQGNGNAATLSCKISGGGKLKKIV